MSQVTVMPRRAQPAPAPGTAARLAPVTRLRRWPRLRPGIVPRERLRRRLAQSSHVPLVLLVAPAGYGKTTLLAQWAQSERRRTGWISLQDADDDASRVLALIENGLAELQPGRLRSVPDGDARATLASLARSLDLCEQPFVLVLDDVHRLRSPAALDALAAIADLLPEGSQLALASREEPALPIGRLRAHGQLVDLRARDLAMTRREATTMLSLTGLELPTEDVLVLLERTEGWPAGLYLAALSLEGRSDVHRAVRRFAGDDRFAADYLRDELLSRLDGDQLEFLRCSSVLDTLTAQVCDDVLGRTGSGRVLRELSRSNALVAAIDSTDATFRCHPMLARMLRAELHRDEPWRETELHRRASAWFASHGDLDRAIDHAIEAGDVAHAGELLWSAAGAYVLDGRTARIRRWLERLPPERVAAHPALALTAAACHFAAGERDLTEHWTAAAERAAGDADDRSVVAGVAVMRAAVARDGIVDMAKAADRAYALAAEDSPWRSLCCLLRGVAAHLRGDRAAARSDLEEGARRGAIAAPSIQVLCLAQLALLAVEEGDWEQGPLLASRAMAQVERRGLDHYPTCALVFAVSALVRAHRDRVEDAQRDRRRATELLALLTDHVPWYEVEARVVLARATLRLGDVADTRNLLTAAARMPARTRDAVVLREWIDDLWSQLDAFSVTALLGPSSLTTAELRILALLPTHLSFPEMGRRLHVSANTIKTHAHAVYRKLDVCSRSEAVIRARETGLLDLDGERATKEAAPCRPS
jgi:LuxR family transcriptional regulator, maltose regulon positive regulatory protein